MNEMTETLHAHLRSELLEGSRLYEVMIRYDLPLTLTLMLTKGEEELLLSFGTIKQLTVPSTPVAGPECESPRFESLSYRKEEGDHHAVLTFRFQDGTPASFDVCFGHVTLSLQDRYDENETDDGEQSNAG